MARHRFNSLVRAFLNQEDFVEIETPFLTTSTPEGARDYLVPGRVSPGSFYALPQSPQIFKQLLMVAGLKRYYQIVRCFRDEDLRADRQPEFTQLDMETSFMDEDQLFDIMERMMTLAFGEISGIRVNTPFPQLTYAEAMGRFGIDKPDIRFGMELTDISTIVAGTEFGVFRAALESGGIVKAMKVQNGERLSRKELDDLREFAAIYGGKGVAYARIKKDDGEWQSPIAKFLSTEAKKGINEAVAAEKGDVILFGADTAKVVNDVLGNLRNHLAAKLGEVPEDEFAFVWITDFPMFEFR